MSKRVKVACVDDHFLFRSLLVDLLKQHSDRYEVVLQNHNGHEFFQKVRLLPADDYPELILLDLNNPVVTGFETALRIRKIFPYWKVIILSMNQDEFSMIRARKLGIQGYLVKTSDSEIILQALEAVMEGHYFFSNEIVPGGDVQEEVELVKQQWFSLTEREKEFVRNCCTELTPKEISGLMKTSIQELESVKRSVYNKLKVNSRIGLVVAAGKLGLY